MKIRIAGIIAESIVDGPGIRCSVFTQGCFHKCPGCHNPQTHDPNGGYFVDISDIIKGINKNPLITGVTITGGEPFMQIPEVLELVKEVNKLKLNIIIYTGYIYEELISSEDNRIHEILNRCDYLIDGPFEINKKSLDLDFRGSSNQRIIDLRKTKVHKQVVEASFI